MRACHHPCHANVKAGRPKNSVYKSMKLVDYVKIGRASQATIIFSSFSFCATDKLLVSLLCLAVVGVPPFSEVAMELFKVFEDS